MAEETIRNSEGLEVHEGRRTGVVVSVRLKPDEADLLTALSERDGRTMSETLRLALHALARSPRQAGMVMAGQEKGSTRGGRSYVGRSHVENEERELLPT